MLNTPHVGKDVEKLKLYSPTESIKSYYHFEKQFCNNFKKLNIYLPYNLAISIHWHLLRRKESICPHKILYKTVYISLIYNSWKLEIFQSSLNRWMENKQNNCSFHYSPVGDVVGRQCHLGHLFEISEKYPFKNFHFILKTVHQKAHKQLGSFKPNRHI